MERWREGRMVRKMEGGTDGEKDGGRDRERDRWRDGWRDGWMEKIKRWVEGQIKRW